MTILFALAGLYVGFLVAPTDATQGDAYRIIFIHVPAAWMSMLLYLVMAGWAVIGWAFNARLASMVARAIAPTGAMFTFLALWSGALWGKPTWGAWWVWDARLTSELILLFLYVGYMALEHLFYFCRAVPVLLVKQQTVALVVGHGHRVCASRALCRISGGADRRHARRRLPNHLHPRAGGLDVHASLFGDGRMGCDRMGI